MEKSSFRHLLLPAVLLGILAGGAMLKAQEIPGAAVPADVYQKKDKGIIEVEVSYGEDGKVATARIIRSNAPYALEASTIDTIKKKWQVPALAGRTLTLPIYFDELPATATAWNEDTPPPRNLLPKGDPGRTLKLQVFFGNDGWVSDERIVQPSGIELLDRNTEIWVKVHWHHAAYANQDHIFPFLFVPPSPATSSSSMPAAALTAAHPAVSKQKPPVKKRSPLAEPVNTEQDEAIPAVRAQ